MFDPILFENALCENADDAVLFCKDLLTRKGLLSAACSLEGLGGINDTCKARLARDVLRGLRVQDPEATHALHMVQSLLDRASQ